MSKESAPRPAPHSHFAFTTRRPVAVLMAVMAVSVFGWVSYQRLPLTLMPDISYPTLTVRTEYPGTAPEEVETLISRPLEQELGIVSNLIRLSSISRAGQSDVVLEFAWDADMRTITQDIREKIDGRRLPDGAERPLLLLYDPSLDPIMRVGFSGPQSLTELRYIAENEIKRALEAIPGVAAVKVAGGYEEEFLVALDESRIALLGLNIDQINNRLAQGNVNLPGGNIREGQTDYTIRTLNEFQTIEEIGNLIVAQQNGANIRLSDIATVNRTHKERKVITRVNGEESIELEIYKEADANIVAVAQQVREALFGRPEQQAYLARTAQAPPAPPGDLNPRQRRLHEAQQAAELRRMTDFISHQLPERASLGILSDQSVFISQSIAEVKGNAVTGGIIAILVLFAFLRNLAHTLIIGITIPVSIVVTFAPMYMADVSLNIISLGGLALGVGMLVDNSIVVLESIFRCRQEGDDVVTGTVRGTQEVGSAVFASTLTTVAVFFPIVFVEGVASQIFGDMALTVVFSLLASLAVALYFIPMLASREVTSLTSSRRVTSPFLDFSALSQPAALNLLGRSSGSLPAQLAARFILALATVAAVGLKALLTLAFLPLLLAAPLRRGLAARLSGWADEDGLWGWRGPRLIWPGLLSFAAAGHLLSSAGNYFGGFRGRPAGLKLLRAAWLPLAFAFFLGRFVVAVAFKLLGSTLQLLGLTLALVVLGFARMGATVLHPIFRPLLAGCERSLTWLQHAYPRLLRAALKRKAVVIAGTVAAFAFCWFALIPRLGSELIPQVHQGEFNLDIALPVGTPLEVTAAVVKGVEREVLQQPEVERTATTIGSDAASTSSSDEGEHTGSVSVKLRPGSTVVQEEALITRLRENLADLPETEVEASYPALFTFKSPIEVEIRGYDLATLKELGMQAEERLSQVPGLADVRSTLRSGNPEIQIRYHRDRLAQYGLSLQQIAELVRDKIQGSVPTDFRERERLIDILVRLSEPDRLGVEELRRLVINPGEATPIPLSAVADISVSEGPSEIRRIDQQRTALITANLSGLDLGSVSREIEASMLEMDFPDGYHYVVGGQNQEMQASQRSLTLALALALFLVYIVMASQFESLLHPLIIMFSVPLALIGVVVALFLLRIPLSILVFIGLIMLAGIVVNNAIVLIDYINMLRRQGQEKLEAVIQAGTVRLRPILMTTLTTVLGLLPMALGLGEGAELRTPMAITVIVGLSSSTLLTLVVIPAVYLALDRKP